MLNLTPVIGTDTPWWLMTGLYRMAGWETCPDATADVTIAAAFGVFAEDLPVTIG